MIRTRFNAAQVGGVKSIVELKNKYKNAKALAKQEISANAKEIKKTGGGLALISEENSFNFSADQIQGLNNPFDNDNEETVQIVIVEEGEINEFEGILSTPKASIKQVII